MAKLLVHERAGVREFELVDPEVHVGRELDNTLRLPDPSISRHHCVLRKTELGYEIQDLQSSNGVLVNGDRHQARDLADGDRITLGQVQLTFQNPRSTEAPQRPLAPSGTVRMSPAELAALHAASRPIPEIQPTRPVRTVPPPRPAPPQGSALARFFRRLFGGGR